MNSPVGHTGRNSKLTSSAVPDDTARVGTTSSTVPQEDTNDVSTSSPVTSSPSEDAEVPPT